MLSAGTFAPFVCSLPRAGLLGGTICEGDVGNFITDIAAGSLPNLRTASAVLSEP